MTDWDWDNDGVPNSLDTSPGVKPADMPAATYRMNPVNIPGTDGVTLDESVGWFAAAPVNNPEGFAILMDKMFRFGHIKKAGDFAAAKIVWAELTRNAGSLGAKSGIVEDWISLSPPMGVGKDSGDGTGRSKSSVATQYTPSSAGETYTTVSKNELGREASDKEMKAYTTAVNQRAKTEPTVNDITTTKSGGVSNSTGIQGTGFNPAMFARDFARTQPDYAENYAARNFVSLIQQSLSDPNRIGKVVQ